ncbi:RING-H2 finger protein ATL32 [Morus notabilis]|uniref:RING-type E3 ubiquitin transferase n=1 Tax=Morus notabilis TaxID=981085 RepID=W9SEZ7_9ROSA|nr:RING-H2 finger protein ATL38 [Morus notabilis]EXC25403.1 RING-H2 finger protein ATL32 [Morus notabilis]
MISSGINLVMTVIGFAVSTLFIVFVCTRLVCARIHLNASRRSFLIASRSDLSILERGLHGLEPVVIASFPTKKYSDAFFSSSEDAQCTACLEEYRDDDVLRILPYCGHSFHVTCIDIWLQQHSTCPICRMSLRECPDRKRLMQPLFSSAIRSRYGPESLDSNSCQYILTNHEPRSHANQGVNSVEQDHITTKSGAAEAGENVSSIAEANLSPKDLENKHVESPSNP